MRLLSKVKRFGRLHQSSPQSNQDQTSFQHTIEHALCAVCQKTLEWSEDGELIGVDEHQEIYADHIRLNQTSCYWCGLISFMFIPKRHIVNIKPQFDSPWVESVYKDLRVAQIIEEDPFETLVSRFGYLASDGRDWTYLGGIGTTRRSIPMHPLKESLVRPGRLGMPIQSNMLDSAAIKRSMDSCRGSCLTTRNVESSRYASCISITLVDTLNMCLVDLTTEEDYICLSYVWGTTSSIRATSYTRFAWREAGVLCSLSIAPLIADAIELVRRLSKRYLWVDQLCIEQDNTSQQHSQLGQMDIIYHQSILTLVAWASTSGDDRISGLNNADIQWSYSPMAVLGNTVARAYFPLAESIEGDCKVYRSRGWTLQEEWLAPRRLYLGQYAVHYHCSICHDGQNCSETFHCNSANLHKQRSSESASSSAFNLYVQAVWRFSQRRFTVMSDTLNAFAGIYSAIGLEILGDSFSGLPACFLEQMLFWNSSGSASNLERNPSFPSWSWAGWIGPIMPTLFARCEILVRNLHVSSAPESGNNSLNPLAKKGDPMNLLCFTAETAIANDDLLSSMDFEADVSGLETARSCLFGADMSGSCKEIFVLMGSKFPVTHSADPRSLVLLLVGCPVGKRPERLALVKTTPEAWNNLERVVMDLEMG